MESSKIFLNFALQFFYLMYSSKPSSTEGNLQFPFLVGQHILRVSKECISSGAKVKKILGFP